MCACQSHFTYGGTWAKVEMNHFYPQWCMGEHHPMIHVEGQRIHEKLHFYKGQK
jgi:hypothetical protein